MSWRDELRRVSIGGRTLIAASFRGVPFFVESAERTGGRRIVTHEFPGRSQPWVEDLGGRARTFPVEAYVLGADYVRDRDAVLAALEDESGPGKLLHPYFGERTVICAGVTVRESTAEGGIARLAIEFQEAPAQEASPTATPDLPGQVATSAGAALSASRTEFLASYDPSGLPAFALASAQEALADMAVELNAALAPIVSSAQELALLDSQLHRVITEASALARDPATALGVFESALAGLVTTATDDPEGLMTALIAAYQVDFGLLAPATSAIRTQERANQLALAATLRRLVAIEASRVASLVPFRSIDEAIAARDVIVAELDAEAGIAGDTVYPALISLRADLVRAVPTETLVARLMTVSRPVAMPSLLLTYQLYGSVADEADVLARNRVRHPAFMVGDYEVLSSV